MKDYLSDDLIDEIFNYTVPANRILARCGLKILAHKLGITVILTELPDNPGMSVTNAVEEIATQVHRQKLPNVKPDSIRWIERYIEPEETFDEVLFSFNGKEFVVRDWRHLGKWKKIEV